MLRRLIELFRVIRGSADPLDWIKSGRPAVEPLKSHSRAATCVACPMNGDGPLTQWFTERAAEKMKQAIQERSTWNLRTPYDGALGVCEACYCPLTLKVHEPIDLVLKHLKPDVEKELWDRCWIRHEMTQPSETDEKV